MSSRTTFFHMGYVFFDQSALSTAFSAASVEITEPNTVMSLKESLMRLALFSNTPIVVMASRCSRTQQN